MLNSFEEKTIQNDRLPERWKSQSALDELEIFLQANWQQRSAFYNDGYVSKQQFLEFTGQKGIRTKNYIGTIVFRGAKLNIFPKVYKRNKSDNDASNMSLDVLMKDLIQWMEYCTKVDYPFISIKSEFEDCTNLQDLFITLYVRYVKSAIDRGLYYRYEEETEDCSALKGSLDIRDYYTKKISMGNWGKMKCTYSNFEYDNKLNRILKYTCKLIYSTASANNKRIIRDILYKLNEVNDENCAPADCDNIRLSKLHRNYTVIISISKMFLLNKSASAKTGFNESFCFMFPTEILFEGFITGFIESVLHDTAKVKAQASDMSLIKNVRVGDRSFGKKFRIRNDILVEKKDGTLFVLDAKYKEISRIENNDEPTDDIKQSDLYQVREYARKRNLHKAYLLYPLYKNEEMEPNVAILEDEYITDEVKYKLDIIVVRVPFVFEEDVEKTKEKLTIIIKRIFEND